MIHQRRVGQKNVDEPVKKHPAEDPVYRQGVYYGCGEAQTDFLVAMGMLLMSILVTILIMIKGTQSWLISLLYIVFKIIDFIIGYLAARQANRVLYILTLVITIVVLVGGIYFAARAIVGIVDHPIIIHIIYFCTKLM
ncbi:hypothetical protein Q1695_010226 [Nippostrongylus brasiliensis]|nr:hypothetical protein Q1695_010226 [Nippostrongylus brasiliensis]